jgi:hypothetical protein
LYVWKQIMYHGICHIRKSCMKEEAALLYTVHAVCWVT